MSGPRERLKPLDPKAFLSLQQSGAPNIRFTVRHLVPTAEPATLKLLDSKRVWPPLW